MTTITFKVYEDHNLVRSLMYKENTAVTNHIITRVVSPASITVEEFCELVSMFSLFNEDLMTWEFSHPELGDLSYDVEEYDEDEYESLAYEDFSAEVEDYLYEWGVIVTDEEEDDDEYKQDITSQQAENDNDYADKKTSRGC